jgi:hypothetical protein
MALLATTCAVLTELGETDCETLGDGWLAQPVNALSSLAYSLIGIVIAVSVFRSHRERGAPLVYAACLLAVGLGSVAFHGPQLSGSQLMHDLPILLTVLFMLNHDRVILRPDSGRELVTFAGVAFGAVVLAVAIPAVVAPLTIGVAGAVVVAEVVISRRHLRQVDISRQRRGSAAIAVVAVVGGASWVLGRSNSPLCEPDSWYQLHGLWHMLSALVFGLWYWWAIADVRDSRS